MKLMKLTPPQSWFLLIYPLGHCLLGVLCMLVIAKSFGWMDGRLGAMSWWQEAAYTVAGFTFQLLFMPLLGVMRLLGIQALPGLDWLWLGLTSVGYAAILLLGYKVAGNR